VNGILSAPILDKSTSLVLGSVDVLDIIAYITNVPSQQPPEDRYAAMKERFQHSVKETLAFSHVNPFTPVDEEATLSEIIVEYFSRGIHRIPLINSAGQMMYQITQMDLVPYLHHNLPALGPMADQTLADLGLVPGNVISVYETATLRAAFELISSNCVSGIAIVHSNGKLAGNLSASDFKGVTEENFIRLETPVSAYIQNQVHITCHRTTTFGKCLGLFRANLVHRIYIVDAEEMPIGIVTLTDVMKLVRGHILRL
jgi:CBS-domain-containing membrane protein